MIALAFKNAAASGDFWSKTIARVTGGAFCHVELWIDGRPTEARCFSSREGQGTAFATINLEEARGGIELWRTVPIELSLKQETLVRGFCLGATGRGYDYLGLIGIDTGHGEHDDHDRFCSEVCVEALQKCAGRWTEYKRWLVWPSGPRKGNRVGLYELVTGQIA